MKIRSKKVCGVSINLGASPSFDKLVELALKSGFMKHKPIKERKKLIEKELRANGFTRSRKSKRKKQADKRQSDNSGLHSSNAER